MKKHSFTKSTLPYSIPICLECRTVFELLNIKINYKNQLEYVKYSFDSNDKYKATKVYSDYNNTVIEVPFDNLLVIK